MRRKLLEALQAGWNVSSAAGYAGVSRPNVYRMRKAWPALDQELSRLPTRERFTGDPEVGPSPAKPPAPTPAPPPADDLEARMRKLGLGVLAQIARDVTQRAQDRVSAARALVQTTAPGKRPQPQAGETPAAPAPAPAEVTPVTADQVAQILRIRPA